MARIPIPQKKHFFVLQIFLVSIIIIELGLQTIYYASRGRATWSAPEIFNYSEFTYFTNDERYVSIKPNYVTRDIKGWSISTDKYGFRIGKQKPSKISNIVFLGDSVPFGWGVDSEDSVPSILHEILLNKGIDVGIINAAVPAYSLDQSVQKYLKEIVNKFPSNVIILQIYDPVSQFILLGRDWEVSLNWTTFPGWYSYYKSDICDYSSLCYLFRHYFGEKEDIVVELLDKDDKIAISNFKTSIMKSLNTLHLAAVDTEKFLLLPVTLPKKSWSNISDAHKAAISALNSELREYAQSSDKILYVDTISLFSNYADEKIFIDRCCHLSSFGA
jgi:hypothetical protein